MNKSMWNDRRKDGSHYIIDGLPYPCVEKAFRVAVSKGFAGSKDTIRIRLVKGAETWEELLRPVNNGIRESNARRVQAQRDEVAEAIAKLDARKREMGL